MNSSFINWKRELKNVNWDSSPFVPTCNGEIYPFNCRKHHWLPATFISKIPFELIQNLSKPGSKVYDPFSGIGTTFFQALLLNRIPYATDINSVCIEYMQSMFTLFNPNLDLHIYKDKIDQISNSYHSNINYINRTPDFVHITELKPWYSKKTLNQLSYLFIEEEKCEDPSLKAIIRISNSAILKMSCCQNRGYGYVADNVHPSQSQIHDKNAILFFKKHAYNLIHEISINTIKLPIDFKKSYFKVAKGNKILHCDSRHAKIPRKETIDLIVTSPPYPNMVDYVKSQRLSYYYFGFDMKADLKKEIGSRNFRSKKDCLSDYLDDMNKINENVAEKVKTGGFVCYVVPKFSINSNNNVNRKTIVQTMMDTMENFNLTKNLEIERTIPNYRRINNSKWVTLEKESIFIFQKN